jgi:hypothetical protein
VYEAQAQVQAQAASAASNASALDMVLGRIGGADGDGK